MSADAAAAVIAARQLGLLTLLQATTAGFTAGQVKHRLRTGRWQRVRTGVYCIAGHAPTWEQAVLAASLAAGAPAARLTAARLWKLPRIPQADHIELIWEKQHHAELEGVRLLRSIHLRAEHVTDVARVPVTDVATTLVHLSPLLGERTLGEATDDALRRRVTGLRTVRAAAAWWSGPGRPPTATIRAVLARRLPGYDPGESELETRVLGALERAGVERPTQQHRVTVHGRRCRIDLAYPSLLLAIEVDGWESHGTRTAFDGDRARRNELEAAGWHVLDVTSAMTDDEIVDVVRRALHRLAQAA